MATSNNPKHDAIIWAPESRADAAQRIATAAGLTITAAGSPDEGRSRAVADACNAEPRDDLRATIAGAEHELIIIVDPGNFGDSGDHDAPAVLQAVQRGARIVTLEPLPASINQATSGGWVTGRSPGRPIDHLIDLPRHRASPGFAELAGLLPEIEPDFGPVRSATITTGGTTLHGSAGRQLLAALAILTERFGTPEFIDAAFVTPAGRARQDLSSLRRLEGTFHALARFPDGRAASITAGNAWTTWTQSIDLILANGRIRCDTEGFDRFKANGTRDDHHRAAKPTTWEDAIAAGIRRLLDPAAPALPPTDHAALLALADTALRSARSGQPESPETAQRALGV